MGTGAQKRLNTFINSQKQSLIVVVGRKCELGLGNVWKGLEILDNTRK